MGFIYSLAVVLVIFEGIIIQCEGAGNNIDIDFETVDENDPTLNKILQDYVIDIAPLKDCEHDFKYPKYDRPTLRFYSYEKMKKFFKKFGERINKIGIDYDSKDSGVSHEEIYENIIKKCEGNLKELEFVRIDGTFWEKISARKIQFPKVNTFRFIMGEIHGKFELSSIFPKLRSVELLGDLKDKNCLDNVENLEELTVRHTSIPEHKFKHIFAKNRGMTKISLEHPSTAKTMHDIAIHLKILTELKVEFPDGDFLLRAKSIFRVSLHELSSVTHFYIRFYGTELTGPIKIDCLSFNMPKLEKLTLNFIQQVKYDKQIVNFINSFKKLDEVEIIGIRIFSIEFIEQLKGIKKHKAISDRDEFDPLEEIFKCFDEHSTLQKLRFVHKALIWPRDYKGKLNQPIHQLKRSEELTLTVSGGGWDSNPYLEFKRDPRT